MDDGKDDDFLEHRMKVDGRTESVAGAHGVFRGGRGVRERGVDDTGKRLIDLRGTGFAKPRPLVLVPVTGVQ
jgi:hypothetical protein